MNPTEIRIKDCFQAQYSLLIETESMLINTFMKSKTEMRYDFSILNLEESSFECRLVQLDIFIHEANNGLINEVAELTGAFNRMFKELHLKMNYSGVVLEVLNMELILSKWTQTKTLMQHAADKNQDLKELISISDGLFTNPEKIVGAIQANEFIQTYFGYIFNVKMPFSKQDSNRTNFFNTAYLPFKINVELDGTKIITNATPSVVLDNGFKKNAYKSFEDKIDLQTTSPIISEESTHIVDFETGKLHHAIIVKREIVDEKNLYVKNLFTMSVDRLINLSELSEQEVDKLANNYTPTDDSRFKFF